MIFSSKADFMHLRSLSTYACFVLSDSLFFCRRNLFVAIRLCIVKICLEAFTPFRGDVIEGGGLRTVPFEVVIAVIPVLVSCNGILLFYLFHDLTEVFEERHVGIEHLFSSTFTIRSCISRSSLSLDAAE